MIKPFSRGSDKVMFVHTEYLNWFWVIFLCWIKKWCRLGNECKSAQTEVSLYRIVHPNKGPVADEWFWSRSALKLAIYHISPKGFIITQILPKNPMEPPFLVNWGGKGIILHLQLDSYRQFSNITLVSYNTWQNTTI